MRATDPCPCGNDRPFGGCCLPLHTDERRAQTAEELMRSRYSAFAAGDADYVWRTWHPRTRPDTVALDGDLEWTGLQILTVAGGSPGEDAGEVEFVAHHRRGRRTGTLHERSRFAVRASRWFYVDGDILD
ncbi:hypothetical protein E4P42_24260 [Mycobacterium sp. PS03-16]|uniref:YchJ family protein n=1 Tax=Mycobacterium sp. PS03-16 TaxID=2559611 RepID=UPI001073A63A|nr:YchJ family metal-binding protein [Mycobacterium sp. PS03-16]TFV55013.1 hypothetical protein E4P42_24260 [Mycobacterium sp. PS03-16]